jgi:uncharacterized membrane protein YdfJ with MMPL/SSD domain
MKLVARIAVAAAVLALAAPALACEGSKEMKTTEKQQAKSAVATAEKAPAAARSQADKPEAKPASAQN